MRDPNLIMFESSMQSVLDPATSALLEHFASDYQSFPQPDESPGSAPHTPEIISSFAIPSSPFSSLLGDDSSSTISQNPGSPLSPVPSTSVQATRSKLIKESLKVSIQIRRQAQGLGQISTDDRCRTVENDTDYLFGTNSSFLQFSDWDENNNTLTPEDEERRRKRRERNKVAATKCRNKKKERTQRLCCESQFLETNNEELRQEISKLEIEKNQLYNMLQRHLPRCGLPSSGNSCAIASAGPSGPPSFAAV